MWRVFKDNWKLIITGLIVIPIVADLIVFCPAPFPCLVVESTKEEITGTGTVSTQNATPNLPEN